MAQEVALQKDLGYVTSALFAEPRSHEQRRPERQQLVGSVTAQKRAGVVAPSSASFG